MENGRNLPDDLKQKSQLLFSWLAILLFGLVFAYGLIGLIRAAGFDVWVSVGLTIPATICGFLGHVDRLRSLTGSIFGSHISVTMQPTNKGARGSRDERGRNTGKSLTRDKESDRQADEAKSHAQEGP